MLMQMLQMFLILKYLIKLIVHLWIFTLVN